MPDNPSSAAYSIEARLVRRLGAILLGAFVLFGAFYAAFVRADARAHAAEEASDLAQDLARAVTPDGRLAPGPTLAATLARGQATAAAVSEADGAPLPGSDPGLARRLAGLRGGLVAGTELVQGPRGLTMMAVVRADTAARPVLVGLEKPVTGQALALTGLLHEYGEEILPTFGPAIFLAFLVAWATIRRSLAPLRRASAEAGAVSADHPGHRVGLTGVGAEIVPLIEAVNRAVARLEQALAVQRRFTANAAHELRTPIAVIRARIDTLPDTPEREALRRDVDRMGRLVSQMLARARLQSGETGKLERIPLAALAQSTLAELAPMAHAQDKDLVLEEHDPGTLLGNAVLLESLLRNLVENALRFTPRLGVVTVRVGPGGTIAVADQGPGIAAADLDRVFEPFWRAPGQKAEGAGLGLAIARDIAELHGGTLRAENTGRGAVFTLTVPATERIPA